ncbi:MAG: TrpB-like pyridoxal phosphate-dependent enzyme [Clostridia bacterium]|nr:TrpB-like pyridoxal phosphate-dependent enzyme [Clostridia bacterium]
MRKVILGEEIIPKAWYNIQADMKELPPPPLSGATGEPVRPEELEVIFAPELIDQEVSRERWIEIPTEVWELYRMYRPTPLVRATRLEKALDTPARIYYKYEGVSPAGSHKLNTSLAQAYFNKVAGIKRLTTETGAGQWGSALSIACRLFDIECRVYMVRVSYNQKPYRRSFMEVYGAEVVPSPSPLTKSGRDILAVDPDSPGSLGIAISEAVEEAASRKDTNYSLGSVLNHVCLHQTVVGLEAKRQLEEIGVYPDVIIGCCGGGSNFSGLSFPFIRDALVDGRKVRAIAVEPKACPTLTRGEYRYDYADVAGLTPLLMMYTLGHEFIPPGIHAGGLRYHGDSPLLCKLYQDGFIEARACGQNEVFQAAVLFARQEGILPAPESAHAVKVAIDEALEAKKTGRAVNILFGLSGHGHFDLTAYEAYMAGQLEDVELTR